METDCQEQSQPRHQPGAGRFLVEVRLHRTGKPDAVDEGMDGETEYRHPTGHGGSCPVLVVMLATRFVIVLHLQLARYLMRMRGDEALNAEQAYGAQGHSQAA